MVIEDELELARKIEKIRNQYREQINEGFLSSVGIPWDFAEVEDRVEFITNDIAMIRHSTESLISLIESLKSRIKYLESRVGS